ncbi:hypothetical protein PHYSODRAFT_499475 [Phytophthora sojae]|uniref:C3HC-type domain-containing protein n=1 Tax=Phytophthora sojae (strain P6497) TaxID=1094619 RepID=G4ZD08_PHYSP|nr:hypothetical protein PHYSODRAFT_499475 [Phytophthora sojae]EGZ18956.1 hypothetical protein PHYSODRAFT_499475 [Phytophthora sojae]|eukprot:XP_009528014.1 hypothetical protein PHYSODRAFT_499475 [Phytophthora sojae]
MAGALGSQQMEELLAAWDDATAPLDARVREDPLLFAPEGELCRPWDHADFLARVGSFSIASWFAKPDAISAFECARHGWRNSAPDQLQCNCCKRFLCFKIDDKLSEAGALKVAEKFAAQLVTGHTELCPWRGNPSPVAFTTLPIATKRQVYETFVEQLGEEVAWMHKDPEFQDRLRRVKVADAGTAKLLQEVNGAEDAATPIDIVTFQAKLAARWSQSENESVRSEALANAAFLIACGWRFDRKDGKDLHMLRCEACNRRWQVSPTSAKVDDGDSEHSEPPTKRLKTAEARPVDLLSQHRHFCPWVAERKSTGVDDYGEIDPKLWEFVKLPGWKQYAQALVLLGNPEENAIVVVDSSDQTHTKSSDPVQALESIRAVLGL